MLQKLNNDDIKLLESKIKALVKSNLVCGDIGNIEAMSEHIAMDILSELDNFYLNKGQCFT